MKNHTKQESYFLKSFFCLLLALVLHQTLAAKPKVIYLNTENESLFLNHDFMEFWADTSKKLSANEVLSKKYEQQFRSSNVDVNNREHPDATYWFHFCIEQDSSSPQWLLELPDPHIANVELFYYSNGKAKSLGKIGHFIPATLRSYNHKNLILPLNNPPNGEYLLKIESNQISSFALILRRNDVFVSNALYAYYIFGLYYGVLFIMFAYNLFFFIGLKDKNYLFYMIYVLSCAAYTFREDGIGYQYFWPDSPTLNTWLNNYFEPFLVLSFSLYSVYFLELKKNSPKLYLIIGLEIGLYLFNMCLYGHIQFIGTVQRYLYISIFVSLFASAAYLYYQGLVYIRYYLIATFCLVLSVFVFQARILGYILHNFYTVYGFNFGFTIEVILMSFALSDKIRSIQFQKDKLQQEAFEELATKEKLQKELVFQLQEKEIIKDRINKELEQKIQERTQEIAAKNASLLEMNQQLADMSAKLENMNSSLDKTNWNLAKEIKQKTISTIAGNEIPYDEFIAVFPTETSCLIYLSELKWKDGYVCQKCKNAKFNKGDTPFSRKCSKCNHRESPMANTLFHGIKCDLNKAFYITYITIFNPKKYTLEALSHTTSLGINTCAGIRKKVLERNQALKNKGITSTQWEEYIL